MTSKTRLVASNVCCFILHGTWFIPFLVITDDIVTVDKMCVLKKMAAFFFLSIKCCETCSTVLSLAYVNSNVKMFCAVVVF